MRSVVLLVLAGCGDTMHGPEVADTGTVGATPDPAPTDDTDQVPETGDAPALPDDGYVSVVWTRTEAEAPTAFLVGQLYEEVSPGVAAVHFAQPQELDACALTAYTVDDLADGVLPSRTFQSAGTLALVASTGGELSVPASADGTYYEDLTADALPFGGSYAVTAPGDAFPAFAADLMVPSERDLLAPSPAFVASGALAVAWTGGDPGELLLRLEGAGISDDRALVICRVGNDGEHVVPAHLVDQLPSGRATLHLEQAHRRDVPVGDRFVRLTGSVVDIVVGSAP